MSGQKIPLFLAQTGNEDHVTEQRNNIGFSKLKRHRGFWGRPGDNIVFSLTILIMDVPGIPQALINKEA